MRSVLKDLESELPSASDDTFDGEHMRHKMQYQHHKIKDYAAKEVRWLKASDWAFLHTACEYKGFEADDKKKRILSRAVSRCRVCARFSFGFCRCSRGVRWFSLGFCR